MISIIIPFYNAEKFLDQCIKSFLAQSYKDWELLLINDGSSDKGFEIVRSYLEVDDRIRLISQVNAGVSSARNKGLLAAKGEFICFCDVDDCYDSCALELMIDGFSDSVDIVKCNFVRDIQGNRIPHTSTFKGIYNKAQIIKNVIPEYIAPTHLKSKGEFCSIWGCLFRASLLKNISFIPTEIMEDKVFWLEALVNARGIYYLDMPLYIYNWVPSSAMNRYHKNYIQNVIDVCSSIKNILITNYLYDDNKNRFDILNIILFQAIIYNELISKNSIIASVQKISKYKQRLLSQISSEFITEFTSMNDLEWILKKNNYMFGYFCFQKINIKIRSIFHRVLRSFK